MSEQEPVYVVGSGPVRRFRCQRGHTWETSEPFTIHFSAGNWQEIVSACVYCMAEDARRLYSYEEMPDDATS